MTETNTYHHLLVLCEPVQAEESLLSSEQLGPVGNDVGCQRDYGNSAYPSGYVHAAKQPQIHRTHLTALVVM